MPRRKLFGFRFGSRPPGAEAPALDINPAVFNHRDAERTDWSPNSYGRISWGVPELVLENDGSLRISPPLLSWLAVIFPAVLGIGLLSWALQHGIDLTRMLWLLLGVGIIALAWQLAQQLTSVARFDPAGEYFQRSKGIGRLEPLPSRTEVKKIVAVQLIPEVYYRRQSRLDNYELNLVLEGGSRVFLVDHGSLPQIRRDGLEIAKRFGLEFWDVMEKAELLATGSHGDGLQFPSGVQKSWRN